MPVTGAPDGAGVVVDVRTPADLEEALGCIHDQVLEFFTDAELAPFVELMETVMRAVDGLIDPPPFHISPLGVHRANGTLL